MFFLEQSICIAKHKPLPTPDHMSRVQISPRGKILSQPKLGFIAQCLYNYPSIVQSSLKILLKRMQNGQIINPSLLNSGLFPSDSE